MGYSSPPSSYTPLMLSHQTGLSITASTANTYYAIGSAISIPRSGIAIISMSGHVSAGGGYVKLILTRGSSSYTYGGNGANSLFGNSGYYNTTNLITITSSFPLFSAGNFDANETSGASPSFIIPVYSGDSLQFYATNGTASDITYIDDLLVMLI
ncbi:MAG: hypothetical protein QW478_13705 [Candidatus Micrarchaeaceae archaeon]